jgi:hypothetical protein
VICCMRQVGWMVKSKVVPDYKLELTNKELDGRLPLSSSWLGSCLAHLLCCFVTTCTFQTFSSTPLLALLLLPLDVFALRHLHAPLPHMHPNQALAAPPCLYFACGLIKDVGGASRDVSMCMYG